MNTQSPIIPPHIHIHFGAYHDDIEIDGVKFLRANCKPEDFNRFCQIVRGYLSELGWGDVHPSTSLWPPPREAPPPLKHKQQQRKTKKTTKQTRGNKVQ